MPAKKPPSKSKKATPPRLQDARPAASLQNLAARPAALDDSIDEQLVDHSGVFRVTSQIAQAQAGHDEESATRFPNESLVMAAQRAGFRDEGVTIDRVADETLIDDEALHAAKRERLATLAARNQTRRRR